MTIAVAIGLHNFAEGLAIGVSAQAGEIGLATVLIIGFALHNATEGFGIVGPLGDVRPSWGWLALAGLIGGGPTFLGSMVGYSVTSEPLELLFYALAGGAILYVIGEVWHGDAPLRPPRARTVPARRRVHGRRGHRHDRRVRRGLATARLTIGAMAVAPTAGICEDDDELRGALRGALERDGFTVRATASGADAVRSFGENPPDVLVLDIGLPDADGRDVCQALRARGINTPVLFLTARDAVPDRISGFHAGGDDYLTKPFALAELLVRVRSLLRRDARGRADRGAASCSTPPRTRSSRTARGSR